MSVRLHAHAAYLALRAGVAFAFLYPPVNALSDPNSWIGYYPAFLRANFTDTTLLISFGIIEVAIALWILSGWKIFYPSLIAAGILVVIVVLNLVQFQVLFRDLSIAAAALALAIISNPNRQNSI
jgi:hypothetical protein